MGATELDYAPLQVELHDPRFADPADQSFVVTSVHLPPSKRVDARDSQIAALLRNYAAPDTGEYRMQLPFKPNRESKVAPTHIIAGDFNTYPGQEQYNMLGSGFVSKIPKDAATTSGHQNFDNVLVDTCANERLLIGGGILQLKDPHNAAKGEVGLSDHYPVFVEVCEVQKTKRAAPADAPAVEEVAAEESIAREVVHGVMEEVKRSVIERATEAEKEEEEKEEEEEEEEKEKEEEEVVVTPPPEAPEAPAAAVPSTEAPPSPPSPAPEPPPESARAASPAPAQTREEANGELDREVAEALGSHPESETGPESGPATSSEESFVIA